MAYNNEHRYALKIYHRAADKPTCPQCHHPHRFSEYIDLKTGLPVGAGCGKCDRENHCRYTLTPKEYFRLNPEARRKLTEETTSSTFREYKSRIFLPEGVMELYNTPYTQSNFGRWLQTVAPSTEALQSAAAMYRLSATNTGAIIFWYIDHQGRPCQGKMMWYRPDGHRCGMPNTVGKDLEKRGMLSKDSEMQRTLFGAHLLRERPEAVVYVVESEKTAIVMSMLRPQHIWLATGGSSMLNAYVTKPLSGRRVVLVPDSGCLHKWQKTMAQTNGLSYSFFEELEQYPANTDLLDVLLGEVKDT